MFCSQKDNKKQWFIRADQICSSIWRRGGHFKSYINGWRMHSSHKEHRVLVTFRLFPLFVFLLCKMHSHTHTRRLMCGFFPPKFIHTQEPFSNMNAHGDKGFDIFKYQSLFLYLYAIRKHSNNRNLLNC